MQRRHFSISSVLGASVLLALSACSPPVTPADPRVEVPLVRAATVQPLSEIQRSFTGVVVARVQSDLAFRVTGKVVERLVDAGQTVRRGQRLMRMDPADLSFANAAQAGAVDAAEAKALQTEADEGRYADLVKVGAVSASAHDQAKASADSARAQLNAARADAALSKNAAAYSVLLADADGVVVDTLAEPGQVAAAGQAVVRLARSGPREAVVFLPETVRPSIGSSAVATMFTNSAVNGTATLRQLAASASLSTRTFEARYVLDGAAASAPLGSTVTIQIADTRNATALLVPLAAIFDDGKGPGVWVIGGNLPTVNWRPVTLVGLGEETATLSGGLKPGEQFVALGAHLLHEGERVRTAPIEEASK
jgi:RND family efflux transporter MFP subunit